MSKSLDSGRELFVIMNRMGMLTTSEAAESLGITTRAIQQAISRGKLRAKRYGRDYLIEPSALDAYRASSLGKVGQPRKKKRD